MAIVADKSLQAPKFGGVDASMDRLLFDITPSDSARQAHSADAISVGVGGNITVKDNLGTSHVFTGVIAGEQIVVGGIRWVMATGTTATGLVGIRDKALR